MEKTYDPKMIEQSWYTTWEKAGYFAPGKHGKPYCIMLPPPNVTGSLHMGHGFQHTLMDALIRFHRMEGDNTLWQAGTDHAGIATQIVVERQIEKENQTRHSLGREAFEKRVWAWKDESGGQITQQLRRMGSSIDWSRERFTMDAGLSYAVQEVFIRLYEEKLIYRGKRLVNWDPHLLTAVSDLEVVSAEEKGSLWHIRYPIINSQEYIVVATTRPETMLGDVAVAVHPEDERYKKFIGKMLKLPLTDRTIPIISDDSVEPSFGSGCVKITPAHDFNDYAVGQRHQLPLINIFTPQATLNENAPAAYRGLDRYIARENIIKDLEAAQLIEKIEPHKLNVPRGERSGVIIEPYLSDQWYVKTTPLAEPAIAAIEKGQLHFVPENWTKTYLQWLHNIQDWCISRQLWWGHRIPVWYDENQQIYVGHDEQHIRKKYQLADEIKLHQDEDVLDTWFSAALWPFGTLDWPENTTEFQTFYPTSVLITGFDIIFFWVVRMVMMGLKFTGKVPFKEVYITGLIRDHEGQKMSKSRGNVLDPIDIIDGISLEDLLAKRTTALMMPQMAEKIIETTQKQFPRGIPAFGTDALRFTFCALATNGRDIRFDMGRVEGYRNFCNKIWNAARFVLMNTEHHADELAHATTDSFEYSLPDKWIMSRLQNTISQIRQHFQDYRFDLLAQVIYEFTWNDYCDWYLELAKNSLNNPNSSNAQLLGTRFTLINVLETLLRLIHPVMPFISEEIWQRVKSLAGMSGDTIQLQHYPITNTHLISIEIEKEIAWLQQFIISIRNIRGEMNIAPGRLLNVILSHGTEIDKQRVQSHEHLLKQQAKLQSLLWLSHDESASAAATAVLGELQLSIPMAGLIDVAAETTRLHKEITKLQTELTRSESKLANENYVSKAPAEVVNKEREKVAEMRLSLERFEQQLQLLQKSE